jgi:hypothetical protein
MDSQEWACGACTLRNAAGHLTCNMCGTPREDDGAAAGEAADCLTKQELLEQVYAGVFGQLCTVTDPGKTYSTVNFKNEEGRWGTAELREAQPYAGEMFPDREDPDNAYGWNGWEACRGDQGTVVHAWTTCGEEAHTTTWGSQDVLLLHMSSSGDGGRPRFLPIEVRGVQAQHQLPLAVPAAEAHQEQQGGGGGSAGAAGAAARDCAAAAGVTAVVASTATGGAGGGGGSRGSGSSGSSSSSDDDTA